MRDHLQASFIKNLPRCRQKLIPSWKDRIGCVKNVSEQASPLECGTLDIPSADGVGFFFQSAHSAAPMERQSFAGALAESRTKSALEIAFMVHMAVNFPSRGRQTMARTIREIDEARPPSQVGKVGDDILDRISRVFQSGGDHEPLASLKTAEEPAAWSWCAAVIDQTEFSPSVGGGSRGWVEYRRLANLEGRTHPSPGRIEERGAVGKDERANGNIFQ